MTGQHRHPYSTDATVPATSPGRHRRPGVAPITQEQRHPGQHRGDVETIARARAERPNLADHAPIPSTLAPGDPLAGGRPAWLGPLVDPVPALAAALERILADDEAVTRYDVRVHDLPAWTRDVVERLVRTPAFAAAAQHVEVVVPLRTLEPATPRLPMTPAGHAWGDGRPARRPLRVVEAGE